MPPQLMIGLDRNRSPILIEPRFNNNGVLHHHPHNPHHQLTVNNENSDDEDEIVVIDNNDDNNGSNIDNFHGHFDPRKLLKNQLPLPPFDLQKNLYIDHRFGNGEFINHDSETIVTCYRTAIDSSFLLIFLLTITISITCLALFYIFEIKRLLSMKRINRSCDEDGDNRSLHGKTVVMTGANRGIGARLANDLVSKGARLVMLCRDVNKAREVSDHILAEHPTADIIVHHIDLSSMTSIRVCVNEVLSGEPRIDVLVNCASVAYIPGKQPTKSIDGHELHLATNYLGPFLLTNLLLDRMARTANQFGSVTKVINVCSIVHRFGQIHPDLNFEKSPYTPFQAYSQSKLAVVLAGREWSRRWRSRGVHVYNVDPGLTATASHYQNLYPIFQRMLLVFGWIVGFCSVSKASENIRFAINSHRDKQSGYYYRSKSIMKIGSKVIKQEEMMGKILWNHTINVCNL